VVPQLSLAPGFSRVFGAREGRTVLTVSGKVSKKPLKRLDDASLSNTRLKPGANEKDGRPTRVDELFRPTGTNE
jgi:hypothetical protein